jgi:tetratricopeptide (TPR) repeat protein
VAVGEDRLPFAEAMSRMRAMLWCADYVQKTAPLSTDAPPAVLMELPAEAPPEVRERADWSLACVQIFRGEPSRKRIAVPIALADEMIQLRGGIATLVFDVYTPGNGRLTPNPEESFRILPDDDFTESLSTAWRIALEAAKNEDGRSEFPDVVWRVIKESPSMCGLDEKAFFESAGLRLKGRIAGRSASGATLRAFRHLLKGTNPDPDVFVLAQVRNDGTPTNQLQSVGGISTKVEAIADTGHSATIVVTEKDEAEARLAVSKKKANSRIHVDVDIPPAIQKRLDGADKLDAEGKYSEALVLIEQALKSAEEGGHEMATIKATIDLAECITRTRVGLERAESVLKPCLEKLPPGRDDKSRESALIYLGHIATTQGRVLEGKSLAIEALESARSRNDRFTIGRALIELGHAEEMLGNLPEALRVLGEAAEYFRAERRSGDAKNRIGAATNLAGCLATRAMVLEHQGNAPEMLTALTEAEQILREGNSPDNLGRTLLTKSRVHFALSQFEQGVEAVREAVEIFSRIENFPWLLKCVEVQIRLAMQFGKTDEALRFGGVAVTLARERGTPHDVADALGQMAALCREHDLKEPAERFLAEAKSIAGEHQLHDLLADCLLDEAGEGKAKTDEQRGLLQSALTHFHSAMTATQVKGRRAVFMRRIAAIHARLANFPETRSWLEQALAVFEEIGDSGGSLQVLGQLSCLAREEGNKDVAISLMLALIDRAKGKPFEHFRASAHHDLVHLMLSQGNIPDAQEHFSAAKALCAGNRFPDIEEAMQQTEERLEMATRYHKPTRSSLAEMLRELRAWTSNFPEQADAILPAWFYLFGAEAWSNCRSLVGVKFLVHAPDRRVFESFAREWTDCGDLFIYNPTSSMRCERGIDIIPWHDKMLVPRTLKLVGIRKKDNERSEAEGDAPTKESNEAVAKAMVEVLHRIPYYATPFSGPVPGLPVAKLYVVGRRLRLPQDVRDTLLNPAVEALIANRIFILPREGREEADTALPMTIAWEGGHLPVFFGDPAPSDELSLEREASVQLPTSEHGKRTLRRFMADVATDSRGALTRLIEDLEVAAKQVKPPSGLVHGKLRVFRFKVGTQLVNHPVLIL